MNAEALTEYRRRQSLVVEQLCRINGRASAANYGLAGKLMNTYGFELVMEVLPVLQEGTATAYMVGALRKQAEKRATFSEVLDVITEGWNAND
jgi:hypothetical protein